MIGSKAALYLITPILSLLLTGCLSPILVAPSSAPLEGRSYVTTGTTTGEACMSNILGIPLSTDASLKTAMKNAMDMASAQALIDIVVDNRYVYTLFFNRSCTVVHATGIRFSSQPAPYLPPAPAVPAVPPIPPAPGVKPDSPASPKPEITKETPPPKPARKPGKLPQAKKKKPAQNARVKKPVAKSKPVPDQYKTFCRYSPGDKVRVETKARVIEAEFVKCVHFGIKLKAPGQAPGVVPFEQVWMVKQVGAPRPRVKPVTPITPDTTKPAPSRAPAQPRTPAQPR